MSSQFDLPVRGRTNWFWLRSKRILAAIILAPTTCAWFAIPGGIGWYLIHSVQQSYDRVCSVVDQ
jgi:hypothetical protein